MGNQQIADGSHKTMKAALYREYGGPEQVVVERVPMPVPSAGEVLVRIAGSGFNIVDNVLRAGYMSGQFPQVFPFVPNIELSGTVAAVGEGVTRWSAGDRVYQSRTLIQSGGAAEYAIAEAGGLAAAPQTLDLADAGGVPLCALTAWQALFEHGALKAGQRVMIVGASGSVGHYAVQFARNADACVIGISSASSSAQVKELGADAVLDYAEDDWMRTIVEPLDLIVNVSLAEPDQVNAWLPLLREGGALISAWSPVDEETARRHGVTGKLIHMHGDAGQLADITRLIDDGVVKIRIDERIGLDGLRGVHARSAAGKLRGKVLVIPAETGEHV
ncbi:NADP-dependent oxidoreductase [Saccharibacillus endophyticus]|uniref:NADPH:quinone reductase n=1 Tax=Saccharibacillus endophyticus TaxID=2060666 RepID=A0ABQ1ZM38_9BACL|nr:NADP-dependent oxidoreductase [Saccharibacillus endophyticus]GGH68831.1 NADPH:quinone reductase [Saccharibacillus endophyticus]